ncbi:IS66 family insertion sequence element accessory protein TnpB [Bradyrhizobium sp. SSUT112]|uniref:IS66 family insertion sequence element accessory protein TnpB n=1 Tax=Bradyrhizobium sp. SSUT112 TaxID=3040604 RepID=UPI002448DD96|nr:IS66 family insertion sequence element accessory protein TnpB [Bradyrhizobium sp. SSUT112]MDH2357555.1 IS66 family insertion sequence element accessory protein TnpB [Bradyrhizobium sp. SSUT112]
MHQSTQKQKVLRNSRLRSGLVLYYKRIEGQFTWPPIKEGVMPLSHAQLSVLLDGSDWKRVPMRIVDQPVRAG